MLNFMKRNSEPSSKKNFKYIPSIIYETYTSLQLVFALNELNNCQGISSEKEVIQIAD
jgi:hypothetical protein